MYDYMYVTLANTLPDSKCVATLPLNPASHHPMRNLRDAVNGTRLRPLVN
jgi:hypothetical protein